MEIKYSPVTYADRITALSNNPSQIEDNKSYISWGILFGLATLVVISIIVVNDYNKNVNKKSTIDK